MYKPGTEWTEKRIKKSCGPTTGPTTDEHFEQLLPGLGCSCAKLKEILKKVRSSYDFVTAFRIRLGVRIPVKILIVPAGRRDPYMTEKLDEAAKQAGCKIKFDIHYTSTGILIVCPAI
jgi:hypothetical protein